MKAYLLDGKSIAKQVRHEVEEEVSNLRNEHGIKPCLAVVLVGNDPASQVYVHNKQKAAIEVGMMAKDIKIPASITQNELENIVTDLGNDQNIHGLLIQLPLPSHLNSDPLIEKINPNKDVDGLHPLNLGMLVKGSGGFIPATPAGIQQILIRSGLEISGKHIVICGRSQIVGKPLSILLSQRGANSNATVTLCHTKTTNLAEITQQADILIAAMGQPKVIGSEMIKPKSVIIDVGTNRVKDPTKKQGFRLIGDVDFDEVCNKASAITPVPGGVGPMTIAMLLANTLKAAKSTLIPNQ